MEIIIQHRWSKSSRSSCQRKG